MGVRRNRSQPMDHHEPSPSDEVVNGWTLTKRPNSFGEAYLWRLSAVGPDGYSNQMRGFYSATAARAWANRNPAPKIRQSPFHVLHRQNGTEEALDT